jgi:phosphoribosylformimino-5-aminoimidazole carboxamide ribotide isomerase
MGRFKVIPAMDLMAGHIVRLAQGDYDRRITYPVDPVELAERFLSAGLDWLHVVDLDGARTGGPCNLETLASIAATGIGIEFGGGVRSREAIQRALEAGAAAIILGSSLITDEERLADWWNRFPGRLVAGVDACEGQVVIRGWQESTRITAPELIRRIEGAGFQRVIYTDIAKDGMMEGPNVPQLKRIAESTPMEVTASGGIGKLADIQAVKTLEELGITGVVVGRAFYEGALTIEELASC